MQIKINPKFTKKLQARFDRYELEVGILEDKPHKLPRPATDPPGSYAGGPVRKKTNESGPLTVAQVSEEIRGRMDVNYLTDPFEKQSSDIIRFSGSFIKLAMGQDQSMQKRVVNLLQAIVRNPILRGDYGTNSRATQKEKGFDRFLIDTGQFFKSITARIKTRGGRNV